MTFAATSFRAELRAAIAEARAAGRPSPGAIGGRTPPAPPLRLVVSNPTVRKPVLEATP